MHKARINMHWLLTAGGVYGDWCPKTECTLIDSGDEAQTKSPVTEMRQVKETSQGERMTANQPQRVTVPSP